MRKIMMLIAVLMISFTAMNAQDVKSDLKNATKFEKGTNAIGLRLGGLSTEITYQKFLSNSSRLEADLGFLYTNGFNLALAYQIVKPFSIGDLDSFNWFVGAGPELGFASSKLLLGVFVQGGVGYNFDFPLSLSLDWRPTFRITPATDFYATGIAVSARYRF